MGSGAVAIPYNQYHGRWDEKESISYPWWKPFVEYLIELRQPFLDQEKMAFLLDNGSLHLDIPIGYGLGSSGALTAAIYDFACDDIVEDLSDLQLRLGLMESFFHGKSSGYDPLISFLNRGVKKTSRGEMSLWTAAANVEYRCYLIDSGSARVGKDQIAEVQKLASEEKSRFERIADLNNQIISSFADASQSELLFDRLLELSIAQFDKMQFLIVPAIQEIWRSTLDMEDVAMKICGAGGGGYYMLFSKTKLKSFKGFDLDEVPLC